MSFFVCQPELLEKPPDRAGIHRHAPLSQQARRHFVERDLAFGIDLSAHPVFVRRQLADARIALTFLCKRPGLALQLDHVVDELDRNIEPHSCSMMRVARLDRRNNALPKLHWMRFAHDHSTCLFENKESRLNTKGNPEPKLAQTALGVL